MLDLHEWVVERCAIVVERCAIVVERCAIVVEGVGTDVAHELGQ